MIECSHSRSDRHTSAIFPLTDLGSANASSRLPSSSSVIAAMLVVCLVMVLAFEATNGFHDSSNAVATVIYT